MRLLGIFLVGFALLPSLQAEDYEIDMSRRAKTGDRYSVVCSATEAARYIWTVDGIVQPATNSVTRTTLNGEAKTILAGPTGAEVHIRMVISEFKQNKDGTQTQILPPNSVVEAKWVDNKTIFLINDNPADEAANQILTRIINAESADMPLDNAIAGTTNRQAVGQKWDIHAATLAEHLTKRANLPTLAKNITGNTTLIEVTGTGLKIMTECTAIDVQVAFEPWMTISNSRIQFHNSAILPIDLQQRPTKRSYRTTLTATGTGNNDGKPHRLDMTYLLTTEYDMKSLP